MDRILFVCTANICRSPMAEAIFNALAEDRGLPFRAESAGVSALEGHGIAPHAATVLEEAGIPSRTHRSRKVDETMLEEANLVLAMSQSHIPRLLQLRESAADGIYTLPSFTTHAASADDVPDPYGNTIFAYRTCFRLLAHHAELLVKRLQNSPV